MSESRFVIAEYCDDVRQEVGNKYSLIGCYGEELIVEKIPTVLPKFCIQIRITTPIDRPFFKLIFRAFLNNDNLAEIAVPVHEMPIPAPRKDSQRQLFMVIMGFAPLVIGEPGRLRVEAETEEGVLHGGSLWIRERSPEDSTS